MDSIRDAIRQQMERLGVSVDHLAAVLAAERREGEATVGRRTIYDWLGGKTDISLAKAERIAAVLGGHLSVYFDQFNSRRHAEAQGLRPRTPIKLRVGKGTKESGPSR